MVSAARSLHLLSKKSSRTFPKWAHFVWGTDIELYTKHEDFRDEHFNKVVKVLSEVDALWTDTLRDYASSVKLGFNGQYLDRMVAFAGFEPNDLSPQRDSSERNAIIVKSRTDKYVGRLNIIVDALNSVVKSASHLELHFILISDQDRKFVELNLDPSFKLRYFHAYLPYSKIVDLHKRALISISATLIDGTPGFMSEGMAYGSIPVHARMESIEEWIADGVNGFLFDIQSTETLTSVLEHIFAHPSIGDTVRSKNYAKVISDMNADRIAVQLSKSLRDLKN